MANEIEAAVVKIASSTDIQSIAAAHLQLLQALLHNHTVMLDLDDAADIDLTVIQLIETARRYAEAEGKNIQLSEPACNGLREDLWRGGFLANSTERRFWLHEGGGR